MCISCGCKNPEDSHGDQRNITVASLNQAATAANLTVQDVIRNLERGSRELASGGIPDHQSAGQAIKERLRPD